MQRVLFVCTGNTCRSPMAEAILKNKNAAGVEVKSSGIFAMNGSDASAHAKEVLTENKIEHHHQSLFLTKEEVNWSTIILTMTGAHKAAILQNFPHAADKIFTLKEYAGEAGNLDVSDPFGGGIDIYRRTFKELDRLIETAVNRLTAE